MIKINNRFKYIFNPYKYKSFGFGLFKIFSLLLVLLVSIIRFLVLDPVLSNDIYKNQKKI